jgi:hypothetical protein
MITDEDITKIIEAYKKHFPAKNDFKTSFEKLRQDINNLQAYVEACAAEIKNSSPKIGLEYKP